MPIIDFSVVVLPAPLRPSKVTTSPGRMSKSTPCRMWDSPYQAWSPATARSGSAAARVVGREASAASAMTDPHIGLPHLLIARDGGIIALGKHLAAGEHGDDVGKVGDDLQIVLDHQHGEIGRASCR